MTNKIRMLTIDKLAAKLQGAADPSTDPRLVGITCLATALMLMQFGAHGERTIRSLANDHNADRIKDMSMLWEDWAKEYGYLIETVNPLIGWADSPLAEDHDAVRRCFAVLSKLDMGLTLRANWGEILAPAFLHMSNDEDKQRLQRMYQHMDTMVAEAAAAATPERGIIGHINAGAGGREIGVMFDMQRRGQDPSTVAFLLTEEDPLVAAICVVNLAIYGAERLAMRVTDDLDEAVGFINEGQRVLGRAASGMWITNTPRMLESLMEKTDGPLTEEDKDALRADFELSGGVVELSMNDADGDDIKILAVSSHAHEWRTPGVGPQGPVPSPPPPKQKRAANSPLRYDTSLDEVQA